VKSKSKEKKQLTARTRLKLLQVGGFVATLLPLIIGVAIDFREYIKTPSSAVSLSIGGSLAVVIVALKTVGKAKKVFGNALIISGVLFALAWLLEPIIVNLKFLLGLLFAGEAIFAIVFKPLIERTKKRADYEDQAEVFGNVMNASANNNNVNGRV
jgi:O-antigen ligase